MTVKTAQEKAVLDWLRAAKQVKGLAALPPDKVEEARERNRRFHERQTRR